MVEISSSISLTSLAFCSVGRFKRVYLVSHTDLWSCTNNIMPTLVEDAVGETVITSVYDCISDYLSVSPKCINYHCDESRNRLKIFLSSVQR